MNWHLLLILVGGPTAMTVPFLVARALVHRHGDPAAAAAYLAWFRAQKAAEQLVSCPDGCGQLVVADRPKELTR